MTRDDLIDAMRRAIKLLSEQTTDMALTEHREPAQADDGLQPQSALALP